MYKVINKICENSLSNYKLEQIDNNNYKLITWDWLGFLVKYMNLARQNGIIDLELKSVAYKLFEKTNGIMNVHFIKVIG